MTSKRLRVAPTPSATPLTVDEVQQNGNVLAKKIRRDILSALFHSSNVGAAGAFNEKYTPYNIRAIRNEARQAIDAWQEVEAAATELLDQAKRMRSGGA
ncbi:hypothetical protein [Williamsia phyllosphaerae]|uniref:Uncharacterized protein n=1 Tax=Williamsia phyllosphaerae TaxID=885042 RepID=A0ABQ1V4S2_9NOCA|nr:hypothetical protein [Williamsia phyllosphaerae]GGF38941.1 hypothetical protein GCM10007298_38290 [Williamsia phyllosphaerae]